MEDSPLIPLTTTEGVLIGHELAEWAGFVSGKLIVKKNDGTRVEFRFGKDSRGTIPKIGSLVSIQHPSGILPEIYKISFLEQVDLYKSNDSFLDSILMGRSIGVLLLVLSAICGGLIIILAGILWDGRESHAVAIFGACGVVYIMIGYLVWNYTGG
jgi:hypothetical protein